MDQPNKPPRKGSFALMDPDQLRELARQGGRAVAAAGTGHRFTSDEAREAGKKGACRDLEHLRRIARLGGLAKKTKRKDSQP